MVLSSFYRRRNWDIENLSDSPKVSEGQRQDLNLSSQLLESGAFITELYYPLTVMKVAASGVFGHNNNAEQTTSKLSDVQ